MLTNGSKTYVRLCVDYWFLIGEDKGDKVRFYLFFDGFDPD